MMPICFKQVGIFLLTIPTVGRIVMREQKRRSRALKSVAPYFGEAGGKWLNAHVCPWWLAYTFDHRLRRIVHHPTRLFGDYVAPGMTVVDVGCGLGFNALGLAELVGDEGRVIAADIQQKMLVGVMKRAKKKGLSHRISPHLTRPGDPALNVKADFIVAFYVVHEIENAPHLLAQVAENLAVKGRFMMVEPPFHVSKKGFDRSIDQAEASGLILEVRYKIPFGRAAVFGKPLSP